MGVAFIIAVIGIGIVVPLIAALRAYSNRRVARSTGVAYGGSYSFAGDSGDSGCDAGASGDGGCGDGGGGGGD